MEEDEGARAKRSRKGPEKFEPPQGPAGSWSSAAANEEVSGIKDLQTSSDDAGGPSRTVVAAESDSSGGADSERVTEAEGFTLVLSQHSASGYKGVTLQSGRYVASHSKKRVNRGKDGRSTYLGSFDTAVEAAVAYARYDCEIQSLGGASSAGVAPHNDAHVATTSILSSEKKELTPSEATYCFFTYRSSGNSCPVGCVMDFNNTCGGGGGGGATRYGCKDSPADACSGKHSDEKSCNADSGCSWCVSTQPHDNPPVSSCVPLANVSGWVKGNACWNTTCTKVP